MNIKVTEILIKHPKLNKIKNKLLQLDIIYNDLKFYCNDNYYLINIGKNKDFYLCMFGTTYKNSTTVILKTDFINKDNIKIDKNILAVNDLMNFKQCEKVNFEII